MAEKEYVLFCDESDRSGPYYSQFYGGVLVGSSQYERITRKLNALKKELNLLGEVKWSKTTENYLGKYKVFISCFLEEVLAGNAKMRVMYHQNYHRAQGLTEDQEERGYYLLYYQFIKHSFGFDQAPLDSGPTRLRLYFDEFPDKPEHAADFRRFLLRLGESEAFKKRGFFLRKEDIQEVHSHEHVLLQCVDVVLGAMSFRLNNKHLCKAPGTNRRGKRTVAKEALYKHILWEIRKWKPQFNVGMTTGKPHGPSHRWSDPYRHWSFVPTGSTRDDTAKKPRRGSGRE